MRKEILHERALIKVNRRDFRRKTTERSCFTGFAANQFRRRWFSFLFVFLEQKITASSSK